jgi:hypothetical protein
MTPVERHWPIGPNVSRVARLRTLKESGSTIVVRRAECVSVVPSTAALPL